MDAIILAGGRGTRLRQVVSDRPKPMAQAGGRPLLEWILLALRREGVRRVILSTCHMSEVIEAYFRGGERWGLELEYARDPFPLGTGGAVRHASARVNSRRFIVLNGDSYCLFDLAQLEKLHAAREARATIWLVPVDDCSRYGTVEIDSQGTVCAFREKTGARSPGLISGGIYLFEHDTIASIPVGEPYSLELELFPRLVRQGLYGVVGTADFLDIGTPESYAMAEEYFRGVRAALP